MDRAVLVVGSLLGVGALLVAAAFTRPRPSTPREVVYLALPLIGAIVLAGFAWSRV
ncbi:MAG: hypothetical protein HZA58_10820 [Acidimicrobiia bacterium]|nr:hypothetical protein [Acidimicrobiia bacterium]